MKTATYTPLFWCDKSPLYERFAHEVWEHIRGAADVMFVVTDGTDTKKIPDYVTRVPLRYTDGPILRACLQTALDYMREQKIDLFYYIDADDLHEKDEVRKLLDHVKNGASMAFSAFDITDGRYGDVKFPPKPLYVLNFNVDVHSWPHTSCYSRELFEGVGLDSHPREFTRLTLRAKKNTGYDINCIYDNTVGWYYYQHDRKKLDRTFHGAEYSHV